MNPIVCTCVLPESERWRNAAMKLKEINGTLINCRAMSNGRYAILCCYFNVAVASLFVLFLLVVSNTY